MREWPITKRINKEPEENKDEEREVDNVIKYQLLMNTFYERYRLNNGNDEQCAKDKEMIEIMEFFQKSLDDFMDRGLREKNFFYNNRQEFDNVLQKALLLFSRHNNLLKDQKLKDQSINTFSKTLDLFEENSFESKQIIVLAANLAGAEKLRDKIDSLIVKNRDLGNEERVNHLEYIRSFITPNDDKVAILNLQKFYQENIKFEEYKVNEKMNARDVELLESLIGKNQKVLEMGCGTGRLITELAKDGYDAAGYDFTERHVKITKEEIEKSGNVAKVFQGDWHRNALADENLDAVYSLGRNILHDYSIVDQAQLFREANRILKPGGRFIFDIPDREAGGYQKMVGEYAEEMKRRGIRNFRYGTIYDSPDGENFATRYAYSPDDIEELARLAGFKIVKVEKRELETSEGDENLYYVLEKNKVDL
ncbi:MAG: methyltransferase domain-containing protein [Candidatus Pacebacteria bacterium]|nr:methyltransferase domain-containing protein [Candidatus Paceibacterota bacterium]MDR3583261.1 methyltransferase domain-containing protein [Candidatus Paceibacterota bacterium]